MFVMVGSEAAKQNGVNLRKGTSQDVDFLSTDETFSKEKLEKLHPGRTVEVFFHPSLKGWSWGEVASLDELYTLKMSHSYWRLKNGSWRKHVRDMAMLKRAGASLIPELHDLLYRVWEEVHGKKPANLEQSPEDFFNGSVKRVYEHDSIHAAVAYYDGVPLFNRILRDGHQVAVDKSKFDALPHSTKLELVREEVYATALERKLIPSDFTADQFDSYDYALMKTLTSFTKGWFPMFIADNYEALRKPSENYVKTFHRNSHRLILLDNAS